MPPAPSAAPRLLAIRNELKALRIERQELIAARRRVTQRIGKLRADFRAIARTGRPRSHQRVRAY